jgi:GNAT superfamily N-acetyltransferase
MSIPRVRPAKASDYPTFVELWPELGIDDPMPDAETFASRLVKDTLIAELDGRGVGLVRGPLLEEVGHIAQLMVSPTARRRGIGRALMLAMADRFRAKGLSRWMLNVKPENVSAIGLYSSLGFDETFRSVVLRFDWSLVDKLKPMAGVDCFEPEPSQDAAIAKACAPRGDRFPSRRDNPDYIMFALRDSEGWRGCAAFAPKVPGAFPFCPDRPELAANLLLAIRPHANNEQMQVVAESDQELEDYLCQRGARVQMRVVNMMGTLP